MAANATAEQEVLGSIPGSGKVLLDFYIRNVSETVTESGFVPVDGKRLALYYMRLTGEMWVYHIM